jgi:hypothetical protein
MSAIFLGLEQKPISGFEAATQMQWWKMKQQVSKPRD